MNLLKISFSFISIFTMLTLVSCEEETHHFHTTSELLAGANVDGVSYYISSAEVDLAEINGTLILDECVTDNTITYYPNGRYEENEGRTKCKADDAPGYLGDWVLVNNETQLSVLVNDIKVVWSIVSIDNYGHKLTRATAEGEVTYILRRL